MYTSDNLPNLESRKIIAIIGLPATGKTTLAKQLSEIYKLKVYHTDDYIKLTRPVDIFQIALAADKLDSYIVEGVLLYKILSSCFWFLPDVVINCFASEGTRQERYIKERSSPLAYTQKEFKAFDSYYRSLWAQTKTNAEVLQYLS